MDGRSKNISTKPKIERVTQAFNQNIVR